MRPRASWPAIMLVGTLALAVVASLNGSATATGRVATPRAGQVTASASTPRQLAPDPSPHSRGRWSVVETARGHYVVSWTSPERLPVTDARPEIVTARGPLGLASLSRSGRTVAVAVEAHVAPDISELDVVLSGQVLDSSASQVIGPHVPYRRPTGLAEMAEDPGVPGTHEIQTSDYSLPSVALPDIPDKAEMLGHVVEPVDADDTAPLVLFLHGRHIACYRPADGVAPAPVIQTAPGDWHCRPRDAPVPSYLGYDYVQRLLASQGYVTVSISANAINDLDFFADDGGASARAALIRHHLDAWVTFVSEGTHHADLSDVVLIGHSRGGEGVNRASIDLPVDAPYDVTGQILIGPTDFAFQTSPYVPTVTILPYCDGDVSDLQGQTFTDAARDLTSDPIALHSSVLVMGANHNFFNREWTPGISVAPSQDDWYGDPTKFCGRQSDTRLSASGQRKVGKTYIAGAVHLFADGDQAVLPMFDGSAVTVPSADDADVRSHAIGGGMEIRRPAIDSTLSPASGAATRFCQGKAGRRAQTCDPGTESVRTPHWPNSYIRGVPLRRAFEMTWTASDQEGGLTFDTPWDLSDAGSLDFRTIVDPASGPAWLAVRLHDDGGHTAVLTPERDGRLLPLPGGGYSLSKRWAQTLRVPLDSPGAVDLASVTGVDLVSVDASGRVWVLDVSAIPSTGLPTLPQRDVSAMSVGSITQVEGDGPGSVTVPVPYTIDGAPLLEDATVRVVTVDAFGGTSGQPEDMTIPAGTTAGSIDVEYDANDTDDPARRPFFVAIYPVHGIETDRYLGGATILDDDPSPTVTVQPVERRVAEGHRLQWKVTLSAQTSRFLVIAAVPVRAGLAGKQLTVGDLPKRFRERRLSPVPALDTPLWKTDLFLFDFVQPGRLTAIVGLPTAADDAEEGPRKITLRFRVGRLAVADRTKTIVVTDQR
jgi:hypothetical protein